MMKKASWILFFISVFPLLLGGSVFAAIIASFYRHYVNLIFIGCYLLSIVALLIIAFLLLIKKKISYKTNLYLFWIFLGILIFNCYYLGMLNDSLGPLFYLGTTLPVSKILLNQNLYDVLNTLCAIGSTFLLASASLAVLLKQKDTEANAVLTQTKSPSKRTPRILLIVGISLFLLGGGVRAAVLWYGKITFLFVDDSYPLWEILLGYVYNVIITTSFLSLCLIPFWALFLFFRTKLSLKKRNKCCLGLLILMGIHLLTFAAYFEPNKMVIQYKAMAKLNLVATHIAFIDFICSLPKIFIITGYSLLIASIALKYRKTAE